ncbi:MAG: UDP-N-acetylglucosamine--N-acetylmuramyl-(pentapeptide) pyrophosphoryl-undecaprenol N-acetylglucosamine transferase [Candidatus Azambacteria bacterium]|nr:UDP-N-acetylglucosamine--N-acetylmuramyl-(pentapeptide) pyrophosphoryl-undecaprenol N-acetylglucosamine transferase [Candidatus Azambacteria bacterium]
MIRIILTGGGTGGHLFPLVAVSRKIIKICRDEKLEKPGIYYLGPKLFLESSLERETEMGMVDFHSIILATGKWRRYFSFKNFTDLFKIAAGVLQALWQVWIIMPDVIFSKGGYGSIATVIAGWLYSVPIIIHESDSVPGLVNRLMAPFATLIGVSFNSAAAYLPKHKTYFTGEAVRESFFEKLQSEEGRALLKLTTQKPIILILGGSQGAQKINDMILDVLPVLLESAEVIHQTGNNNYDEVFSESKVVLEGLDKEQINSYHPIRFLVEPEYVSAIQLASVVISRSGAGSIFEIAAAGKASILIPITNSPGDHSRRNAYNFAAADRAEVIEESNLSPNLLLSVIYSILNNPEKRKNMEEKAKQFATPDAAQIIARALINLASR